MIHKFNIHDLDWQEWGRGPRFEASRKPLTPKTDPAPKIGASLYRLAPGKRAFPRHHHAANDEAVFVLKGTGTLLYGDAEYDVAPGDYVHLPAGTGEAHQLVNTGEGDLEYLCVSSMIEPEVTVYPDSDKVGIFTGRAPGSPVAREGARVEILRHEKADYWDGEEEG